MALERIQKASSSAVESLALEDRETLRGISNSDTATWPSKWPAWFRLNISSQRELATDDGAYGLFQIILTSCWWHYQGVGGTLIPYRKVLASWKAGKKLARSRTGKQSDRLLGCRAADIRASAERWVCVCVNVTIFLSLNCFPSPCTCYCNGVMWFRNANRQIPWAVSARRK